MASPPASRGLRPGQPASVTTSFLVGNLHCPTCVSTIREVLLEACGDHICWVSPNIVTSVVTVEHDPLASLQSMAAALTDAGFDICGVTTSGEDTLNMDLDLDLGMEEDADAEGDLGLGTSRGSGPGLASGSHTQGAESKKQYSTAGGFPFHPTATASSASTWGFAPFSRWITGSRYEIVSEAHALSDQITQAHLANCEQCRLQESQAPTPRARKGSDSGTPESSTFTRAVSSAADLGKGLDRQHAQLTNRTAAGKKKAAAMSDKPETSFVTVEHEDAPASRPVWRANLAIGGMTCAVCVNAISDELKKYDWVSKVSVNLISNSAAVEFDDEARTAQIVEAIEDLGYDAAIDSVVRVDAQQLREQQAGQHGQNGQPQEDGEAPERTVEIRIDGLYCEHCPDRVISSLAGFRRSSLRVVSKPTPQRPLLKLAYVPEAPKFTIRHILAAIEASDAALTASLYHPPTLEERSRRILRKHQRQILYRVVFAGAVSIPAFVIGIVYMSLLPASSAGRMFIMAPLTSGISRAQIALFIMATPVYFLAADIFHVRAIKEIRTLWRRGSRTPILQRFYRFGSMNTLMSLGTTIAYVSSVSQMIAAAAHHHSNDTGVAVSNSNFYFDSVIFLTFFLLVGRLIETYSKSRTGDAVEMLGRLRPATAILINGEKSASGTTAADAEKRVSADGSVNGSTVTGNDSKDEIQMSALTSAPASAPTLAPTGSGVVVKADLLDFGDIVRVLHGASPPADGVVVHGQTSFDESSLTGESRLVLKQVGDDVFSGTVNKDAPVLVRVTGAAGTSMLDQIVAVVREGQTKRAPMEQIADLLTTYFVPVVTLVAISTWIIWLSLGLSGTIPDEYLDVSSGGWVAFSLQFAIAVFVVACPCGLGLAAPTAIFVAGGMAAKYGILAKGGGEAFETASRIDCVVFDKTGTLTMGGEPTVNDAALYPDDDDEEDAGRSRSSGEEARKKAALLAALQAVEENSSHPVAKAIVSFCTSSPTAAASQVENLQELAGRGMRATCQSSDSEAFEILVGNEAMMGDFSVAISPRVAALLLQWKTDAKSIALVATRPLPQDKERQQQQSRWCLAAALSVADPVRPEAAPILASLQARGVLVYMLSGDNAVTAAAVARQLGIPPDQVIAEVLPTEKAAKVQALQASLPGRTSLLGRKSVSPASAAAASTAASAPMPAASSMPSPRRRAVVAMVGDGINDSPALTQADVGIAVGSGSDVAISSADFVLVHSNLQAVVTLLELSRAVFRRITFNFGWALIYNVLAIPIAAGVLYPIHTASTSHVRLDPVWASLAMALSSISVVTSSLALRSRIPGVGFRPTAVAE